MLCWEGDCLKKTCVGCQFLDLPVPDAKLVPLARVVCTLGNQQLPLSIVDGSPSLLLVLGDHRHDARQFMVVQRFNEEVFMQCFRQAHQDVFGMLAVMTAVEHVILRLKSVIHEDWMEEKPCLKKCVRAEVVNFGDLRAVLTDLIKLWPSFRPYIRYTGHPHLKDVVDRVRILKYILNLSLHCWSLMSRSYVFCLFYLRGTDFELTSDNLMVLRFGLLRLVLNVCMYNLVLLSIASRLILLVYLIGRV